MTKKITELNPVVSPALSDLHEVAQSSATESRKESNQQLLTLFNANAQINENQVTGLINDLANKQPLNANLTSLSNLSTEGLLTFQGNNTFSNATIEGANGNISVQNGDAVNGNPVIDLADTNVVSGDYGTLSQVPHMTFDQKGRCVNANNIDIQISEAQVTNLIEDLANKQSLYLHVTTQTSSYVIQISDLNGVIRFNAPSNVTLTLPQQSTLALQAGSTFQVVNTGAGKVTIVKEGIDIVYGNTDIDSGGHATITLIAAGSPNVWYIAGNTSINLDSRQFFISSPVNGVSYPLMEYTSGSGVIINLFARCDVGSCALTLQINKSTVPNVNLTAYYSREIVPVLDNNSFATGSTIFVTTNAVTNCSNLVFGIEYLYRGVL